MNFWIGTSGFQYPAWKGTFYPESMPVTKMLAFYAEKFATTEINYTFRRIPNAKTMEGWLRSTPEQFRFSLKAPQRITHFAKLKGSGETLDFFCKTVAFLGPNLGPILFQLPPTFQKDFPLLEAFLQQLPGSLLAAFEFRHTSWFSDDIYAALRAHNAALCLAESADLSTPAVATAPFGYLRLRREDYNDADLDRWATWIFEQGGKWNNVFVYFKHEEQGIGPKLALQMLERLRRFEAA